MTMRKTTRTTKTSSVKSAKTTKRPNKNTPKDPKAVIDAFVQTLKNLESHLKNK